MSRIAYEALIKETCKVLNLAEPENVLKSAPVTINDVDFMLPYSGEANSAFLTVYCDYGAIEPAQQDKIFSLMLKENFARKLQRLPIFTVIPESNHAVTVYHFLLKELDAKTLIEQLVSMADAAKAWRKAHLSR